MAQKMATFEEFMEKAVQPGADQLVPGCVCMATNKDGITYSKSFGTQAVDPKSSLFHTPMSPDATMWIASCTKLMTAIAVLQCVDRGLLDLDADVSSVLTEFKDAEIVTGFEGEEEGGKPIFEKAKNKLTLRLLLTHSSGLSYSDLHPLLVKINEQKGIKPGADPKASLHDMYFVPLVFEPGTSWNYGSGADWAGQCVQRVNGNQSLGDFMSKNIWEPLGMTNTTFHLESRPDLGANRPDMAMRLPGTSMLIPSPTRLFPETLPDDHGGAGLFSCPADYIKLLRVLLLPASTPHPLLSPASLELLFAPTLSPASKKALETTLFASYPGNEGGQINLIISGGVMTPASDPDWALGGLVARGGVEGRRAKGSLSWGGLPNLFWVIDRENDRALFYASQLLPPGDRSSTEVFGRFEEAIAKQEIGARL